MPGTNHLQPLTDDWTADDWERRRAHAAAYLATDPGWIVGPGVVAMYERGRDRARAKEAERARSSS